MGRAGFCISDKSWRCDAGVHRSTRKAEEEGGPGVSQAVSWRQPLRNHHTSEDCREEDTRRGGAGQSLSSGRSQMQFLFILLPFSPCSSRGCATSEERHRQTIKWDNTEPRGAQQAMDETFLPSSAA